MVYKQIQRLQARTNLESEQATKLVAIISDLFSPYNIPIRFIEVTWDSDSETDSNEYEWDSCSDVTKNIEVDTIHAYTPKSHEGQGSRSQPFEFGPQHIYESSENE